MDLVRRYSSRIVAMQAGRKIADLPRDAFFRASEVLAVVIGRGAPETMAAEEAAQ
jgi:branched-chain amino acid transport system ATP-binding protein